MDSFMTVKKEVQNKGLTAETIAKVLEIIEFANDNDVEFYLEKGKLRMKSTIEPPKKTGKPPIDDIFDGKFDMFNELFKTKKKK